MRCVPYEKQESPHQEKKCVAVQISKKFTFHVSLYIKEKKMGPGIKSKFVYVAHKKGLQLLIPSQKKSIVCFGILGKIRT